LPPIWRTTPNRPKRSEGRGHEVAGQTIAPAPAALVPADVEIQILSGGEEGGDRGQRRLVVAAQLLQPVDGQLQVAGGVPAGGQALQARQDLRR
jgi:hypothetical protein